MEEREIAITLPKTDKGVEESNNIATEDVSLDGGQEENKVAEEDQGNGDEGQEENEDPDEAQATTRTKIVHSPSLYLRGCSYFSCSSYIYLSPLCSFQETTPSLVGTPAPSQLSFDNHPFFKGLHALRSNLKSFFNEFLATKGDVFKECLFDGFHFKILTCRDGALKLERNIILDVTSEVISEVAITVPW